MIINSYACVMIVFLPDFGFSRQGFPGCPGAHSVDQAGLELRNLPAYASYALVFA